MKTTKRILALITALVLCLAPTALMVGASEIAPCATLDRSCNMCGNSNVSEVPCQRTLISRLNIGTYSTCQSSLYIIGHYVCNDISCGYVEPKNESVVTQHPTIYYNEDRTRRFCVVCGYEEYGEYFGK